MQGKSDHEADRRPFARDDLQARQAGGRTGHTDGFDRHREFLGAIRDGDSDGPGAEIQAEQRTAFREVRGRHGRSPAMGESVKNRSW